MLLGVELSMSRSRLVIDMRKLPIKNREKNKQSVELFPLVLQSRALFPANINSVIYNDIRFICIITKASVCMFLAMPFNFMTLVECRPFMHMFGVCYVNVNVCLCYVFKVSMATAKLEVVLVVFVYRFPEGSDHIFQ